MSRISQRLKPTCGQFLSYGSLLVESLLFLSRAGIPLDWTSNFGWCLDQVSDLDCFSGFSAAGFKSPPPRRSTAIDIPNVDVFCAPVIQVRGADNKSSPHLCIPLFVYGFYVYLQYRCVRLAHEGTGISRRRAIVASFSISMFQSFTADGQRAPLVSA